jgi:nanoRNase/pAp phosphatase (c-di-AMP/oligoRNAs hydrolase)
LREAQLARTLFPIDLLVGFSYRGVGDAQEMRLSIRSVSDYPALDFAKRLGGGGHKKAAGASFSLSISDEQPYTMIARHFEQHELYEGRP